MVGRVGDTAAAAAAAPTVDVLITRHVQPALTFATASAATATVQTSSPSSPPPPLPPPHALLPLPCVCRLPPRPLLHVSRRCVRRRPCVCSMPPPLLLPRTQRCPLWTPERSRARPCTTGAVRFAALGRERDGASNEEETAAAGAATENGRSAAAKRPRRKGLCTLTDDRDDWHPTGSGAGYRPAGRDGSGADASSKQCMGTDSPTSRTIKKTGLMRASGPSTALQGGLFLKRRRQSGVGAAQQRPHCTMETSRRSPTAPAPTQNPRVSPSKGFPPWRRRTGAVRDVKIGRAHV